MFSEEGEREGFGMRNGYFYEIIDHAVGNVFWKGRGIGGHAHEGDI
jgi:hypothetical protein